MVDGWGLLSDIGPVAGSGAVRNKEIVHFQSLDLRRYGNLPIHV